MIESVVVFAVALLAIAAWQERRWLRSPLGQANAALARARRRRARDALARWHAFQWAILAAVVAAGIGSLVRASFRLFP